MKKKSVNEKNNKEPWFWHRIQISRFQYNELLPLNEAYRRKERHCEKMNRVDFCPKPWNNISISCDGKVTCAAEHGS